MADTTQRAFPVARHRVGCHLENVGANQANIALVSDLAKKHYHFKTYGNPNVRVIDLAQALKAAGDKIVTVDMGPQDHDSFTPSQVVVEP